MQAWTPPHRKPMPAGLPATLAVQSVVARPSRMRGRQLLLLGVCVLLLLTMSVGCAKRKRGPSVPVSKRPAMTPTVGATEEGIASWYGHPYHGRRTANGETYDQELMTAAHPSLPFNVWVTVNNLDNGQQTTVRINDRGPFVKGRIIDLSRAAARAVSMLGPGTAKVRITVIDPPSVQQPRTARNPAESQQRPSAFGDARSGDSAQSGDGTQTATSTQGGYAVQFGAFRNYENALSLRERVVRRLPDARVVEAPNQTSLWLVLGGTNLTLDDAEKIVRDLGSDFPRIFPLPAH